MPEIFWVENTEEMHFDTFSDLVYVVLGSLNTFFYKGSHLLSTTMSKINNNLSPVVVVSPGSKSLKTSKRIISKIGGGCKIVEISAKENP